MGSLFCVVVAFACVWGGLVFLFWAYFSKIFPLSFLKRGLLYRTALMHRRGKHKEKNYSTGKTVEHWKKKIFFN